MTYYVLSLLRVASRKVCLAGVTISSDQHWMEQMARNLSFAESGSLNGCRYQATERSPSDEIIFYDLASLKRLAEARAWLGKAIDAGGDKMKLQALKDRVWVAKKP